MLREIILAAGLALCHAGGKPGPCTTLDALYHGVVVEKGKPLVCYDDDVACPGQRCEAVSRVEYGDEDPKIRAGWVTWYVCVPKVGA